MDVRFSNRYVNMYEQNRYSIFERNIPLISLSSISAFENLDASHSSHGTSHSLKPTPIGYVGNLTNSAPSTEAIPERLFQELAPTFALVQRRIGKDSQGVSGGQAGVVQWVEKELANPKVLNKLGILKP